MSFLHLTFRNVSGALSVVLASVLKVAALIKSHIFMFDAMSFYQSLFIGSVVTYVTPIDTFKVFLDMLVQVLCPFVLLFAVLCETSE